MDTFLLIIILTVGFVLAIQLMRPGREPPQIIYVQTETPQSGGLGCLPLVVLGILLFVVLNSMSS